MLPGTLCTGAIFAQQVQALHSVADRVEIVEFQTENSIEAMARSVERSVPDGTRLAVAGFSMGGMVALAMAARYPERLAGLALLNSNCHAEIPGRIAARRQHLAMSREMGMTRLVEEIYLPRYLHRQEERNRKLILDMARQLGPQCFEAQVDALAGRVDASRVLGALTCPTLILGSENDELCPPAMQRKMHGLARCSNLVMLSDCGHFSTLERPGAVSDALVNWYRGCVQSE